ncbi:MULTISPECIES: AidA/PixA family protein [Burkholderia]|uniref:AidA/PixA family protein n=1 Tax=Burkholderia TaxID=32008 RepID=UPI0005B71C5F|nr:MULTISPECIES: AidA/PixA family protein [Burkholderia]AJX14804.1 inclusion body family protein [Burkholderia ubonensis MSMB22]KIP17005.1 inclusion body family protein [Burkholderia sp. MSHR3999]
MATINVLVSVDGNKLAQQVSDGVISPGTPGAPTSLGSYAQSDVFVTMVAPNASVANNTQGQSELQIKADARDEVEWAITTFDVNGDYTVYLYNGSFNPANAMGPLTYVSAEGYMYLGTGSPASTTPTKFINQTNTVSATIEKVSVNIQYTLSFVLVNNSNGKVVGYFYWDPFIQVG